MTERGLKNINVFHSTSTNVFFLNFVTFFTFFNVFYIFFWNVFYIYALNATTVNDSDAQFSRIQRCRSTFFGFFSFVYFLSCSAIRLLGWFVSRKIFTQRDIVMDIGCYFFFFLFLVKLIKYLYFILVVWLNLYYHYWWNKDDQKTTLKHIIRA